MNNSLNDEYVDSVLEGTSKTFTSLATCKACAAWRSLLNACLQSALSSRRSLARCGLSAGAAGRGLEGHGRNIYRFFLGFAMEAFQSEWMSMRRGGGGGGDPIARPIGVMMLLLLPLGSLAHYTGQNQMCAAMIVGIIFGSSNLDASGSNTALSAEVIYAFIELGNALVMFFDGLADADVGVITYSGAVASIKIGKLASAGAINLVCQDTAPF